MTFECLQCCDEILTGGCYGSVVDGKVSSITQIEGSPGVVVHLSELFATKSSHCDFHTLNQMTDVKALMITKCLAKRKDAERE